MVAYSKALHVSDSAQEVRTSISISFFPKLATTLHSYSKIEVALLFLHSSPACEPESIWTSIESSLSQYESDYVREQIELWHSVDALDSFEKERSKSRMSIMGLAFNLTVCIALLLYQTCYVKKWLSRKSATSAGKWIRNVSQEPFQLSPDSLGKEKSHRVGSAFFFFGKMKLNEFARISRRKRPITHLKVVYNPILIVLDVLPIYLELRLFIRSDLHDRLMERCSIDAQKHPLESKMIKHNFPSRYLC